MKKFGVTLIGLLVLLLGSAFAQDEVSTVSFQVLRDYSGKPVRNASVVLHPVEKGGKQSRGGLELKADADGKASYDGIPYGKMRVQVLAPGFQTFGQDYEIDKPTIEITIKLKRPQGQYSIYESHPEEKKPEEKSGEQSDPNAKPK